MCLYEFFMHKLFCCSEKSFLPYRNVYEVSTGNFILNCFYFVLQIGACYQKWLITKKILQRNSKNERKKKFFQLPLF